MVLGTNVHCITFYSSLYNFERLQTVVLPQKFHTPVGLGRWL